MSGQLGFFDSLPEQSKQPSGADLKKQAMQAVLDAANEEWRKAAFAAVHQAAFQMDEFTTDEVVALMPKSVRTKDTRAFGPILKQAAKDRWVYPTGRYRNSTSAVCHSRPKAIWASRIVGIQEVA